MPKLDDFEIGLLLGSGIFLLLGIIAILTK